MLYFKTARLNVHTHHVVGSHPRIGAMDVCPFVPVANTTVQECVECSKVLGDLLAKELGVPVFLYEDSQDKTHRKHLEDIRKGEYEGLKEKVGEWLCKVLCIEGDHIIIAFS